MSFEPPINNELYTAFFRDIAANHKSLGHTEAAPRFVRVVSGSGPLDSYYIDEFLSAQKVTLKPPFMVLETYDAEYNNNNGDTLTKNLRGAFIILDKMPVQDYDELESILDSTEVIAQDILSHIREHYTMNLSNGQMQFEVSGTVIEKVGPISENFFGVRCAFTIGVHANREFKYNSSKWNNPLR